MLLRIFKIALCLRSQDIFTRQPLKFWTFANWTYFLRTLFPFQNLLFIKSWFDVPASQIYVFIIFVALEFYLKMFFLVSILTWGIVEDFHRLKEVFFMNEADLKRSFWNWSLIDLRTYQTDYNYFHNILRLFVVLPNFPFTTNETIRDYFMVYTSYLSNWRTT